MVVITRLPGKFWIDLACIFGDPNFKPAYDGRQILGLGSELVFGFIPGPG